ncbi:MAG: aldo/keto reductase [Flavobacterium sp.]|nr:aldo/keto reductase [Flavobacterium sp.]
MVELSPIIAGAMNWGIWGRNLQSEEMAVAMNVCVDNSITTFDHADIYGNYTTEAEFGRAWHRSGISRDRMQLSSKCGIQLVCDGRPTCIKHYNYSREHILASVENSLRNLKTDYLDVLLLHRPSPLMQPEIIAESIATLQQQGKVRDFGLSNFSPSQSELIRKWLEISYNQIEFSVTCNEAMTNGSLDYMQMQNIRPMAWNPLGCVFRADTLQTERMLKLLARLQMKYDCAPETILLAWILRHPGRIIPVVGTVNPERVAKLMDATKLVLDDEDWFELWEQSTGTPVA